MLQSYIRRSLARTTAPFVSRKKAAPSLLAPYLPQWCQGFLVQRPPDWRFNIAYKQMSRKRRKIIFMASMLFFTVGCFDYKFNEAVNVHGNPGKIQSTQSLFWLRALFGRGRSRWFGWIMSKELDPKWRSTVYQTYAWWYGSNLDEIRYPLESYRSLSEFFSRNLQDGVRPVCINETTPAGTLCSPADGEIVNIGQVTEDRISQIKGATYSVSSFLGTDPLRTLDRTSSKLMFAVVYLAPGDYHRFHSPNNFQIQITRHFMGEVLPVFKGLAKRINDLFVVNERVVMSGTWDMGVFHYIAVAAYNVGGIVLPQEPKMVTNRLRTIPSYMNGDLQSKVHATPVEYAPGEQLGYFKMGSTVVVIFEAPFSFQFDRQIGDSVKMGELLGSCHDHDNSGSDPPPTGSTDNITEG